MGDNTDQVRGFWVKLLLTPAFYIGAGGGLIGGYVLGRIFG